MTTAIHLRACASPLGAMTIAARTGPGAPNGGELIGVWFDDQTHNQAGLPLLFSTISILFGTNSDIIELKKKHLVYKDRMFVP